MEYKAAVLGKADFVMPFSAMGLNTFAAKDRQDTIDKAKQILETGFALVVVSDEAAEDAREVFEKVRKEALPIVFSIPAIGHRQAGAGSLYQLLKAATGVDITKEQ